MVKKNFLKSSLIVLAVLAVALIPTASVNAAVDTVLPSLTYSAHVQNVGWTTNSRAGSEESQISRSFAGSEGKSQRLEALKVTFTAPAGVVLKYDAHIQGIGWTGWNVLDKTNQLVGTEGQSKRLEALKLSVTGLTGYEIKYRAHVQGIGWQNWLTVDNSQDETSNFVGTQGQSKRIEAIEVLILKTADADIFDARQEAIADLMTYANANEYKKNAKLLQKEIEAGLVALNDIDTANNVATITKALNDAEDKIDEILTDRDINESLATLNTELDNWVKEKLSDNVRGKEELGKYSDVSAIKEAIADAKAEAANKEQYVKNDFDGNILKTEAQKAVRYAFKEYALNLATEEYNRKAVSDSDMVLKNSIYKQIKTALADTESETGVVEKKYPSFSDTKTQIAKLDTEANLKEFGKLREQYQELLDNALKKAPYTGGAFQNATHESDLMKLLQNQYATLAQVDVIANVVSNAKKEMNTAQSSADIQKIHDETININILNGYKVFIRTTLTELESLENASGYYLRKANNSNYTDLMTELENKDATALTLKEAFNKVLDNLIQKASV